MKMKKNKGFTLIELLVVIAIIGLLSTLAVVALNNARAKSRDARRISDVKQVQTALEMYFNDLNAYPSGSTWPTTIANGTSATYMAVVPTNPAPGGTAYTYVASPASCTGTACISYTITFTLEAENTNIAASCSGKVYKATPNGLACNI